MKKESAWKLPQPPEVTPVTKDLRTEVLIIGAGITGITAAYLLAKAGRSVVVVDRARLCSGETLYTTAHISYPTDIRLGDLVKKIGHNHAQAVWEACHAASEEIRRNITTDEIECELRTVPGYLYAAQPGEAKEIEGLQRDARLASEMGFDSEYIEQCPVSERPAVRFSNLMKFHPTEYGARLAQAALQAGCQIFEESETKEFDSEHHCVHCNGHRICYNHVFIATHVPLQGGAKTMSAALLQTKLAGYSTYAIQAQMRADAIPRRCGGTPRIPISTFARMPRPKAPA